jgi:Fe-S oxidoreductase
VLDLCLECKGCKGECPSNVDMAKIKYEFLAHYLKKHGVPVRSRIFAHVETLNRWGSRLAPLSNWVMQNWVTRQLLRRTVGITPARRLPPFARVNFLDWFRKRRSAGDGKNRSVILFNDCFMTYNYPQIGRAATELLERLGFEVLLFPGACCGRPMISKGLVTNARACAKRNVEALKPYLSRGLSVVGCEPSCLLTFRDEYLDLLQGEAVQQLARNSFLIEEFLDHLQESGNVNLKPAATGRRVLLHGHCHQKAHIGTAALNRCLERLGGFEVVEIDSGCCGMAGSFGFEAEHYQLSMEIGQRCLFKAVRSQQLDVEVAASGVSCRQQIEHGTGRKACHPVELLNEVLR